MGHKNGKLKNNKILFFIGGSYVSGLEVVTLHLIKGLKENEYEIQCIISGWNNGDFKERLRALDVKYHEIKLGWIYIRKPLWTIDSLIHYPKAYLRCKKIIKDFEPDVFHFANFFMPFLIYPLIKTKSIYNLQESYEANKKHGIIFRLINKKISIFTAVSNHIVQVLEKLSIEPKKIKLIYNGIPMPLSYEIRNNNSHINIAIIGQVAEWKGHHTLIEAVSKLVTEGVYNFKVLVYGNNLTDYGTKLKNMIAQKKLENYFSWEGFVKNQEDIYSNCDIIVVPTLTGEPCSLTIIEAMAYGKELIVSDRGGNPELVNHKENGLVFPADDPIQLSACILKLITEREYALILANNARKKAVINYKYSRMAEQYIDIYKEF
jgi:glycosyltransferase involved in cell wall biosynthesis